MAEGAIAPIGRRSIVDGIYERLSNQILSGEMQPGEALPAEQELAERPGVSRPGVREGVNRLAAAGPRAGPAGRGCAGGLGVSRPAVREGWNRLGAARLVSMRHSGGKRVLDFRRTA